MSISTNIWVWIAALLTLAIYSFLYKDNVFYKIAEKILVGVSIGYLLSVYWHNTIIAKVWNPLVQDKNFLVIIPLILGLLMFSRLFKGRAYISRIPIAFVVGTATGMSVPSSFENLFKQVQGTMPTVFSFGNIVILVGVITTLVYFFFSLEHKGFIGKVSKVGITFIMIGFGAAFGATIMARISLFIGRIQFLLRDWLGVIQ
ncbi:MAG: hypothetical protein SVK54_06100 [candidate division WOR-3 bacterium]|nr:hypothetical protein [candidate division WOR-3 bacterium]